MSKRNLKEYNLKQKQEIEKYKWIKSEQEGKDIGSYKAALEWIEKYAEHYNNVDLCHKICPEVKSESCPVNQIINQLQNKDHDVIFDKDKKTRSLCEKLKQIKGGEYDTQKETN